MIIIYMETINILSNKTHEHSIKYVLYQRTLRKFLLQNLLIIITGICANTQNKSACF